MLTKKALYSFLENQPNFNKEVDAWIADEFIYTLGLLRKTKKQIRTDGNAIIINVSKDSGREVLQSTAAFAGYRALIKQALEICKHLPVSPKARKELAQEIADTHDDFNA